MDFNSDELKPLVSRFLACFSSIDAALNLEFIKPHELCEMICSAIDGEKLLFLSFSLDSKIIHVDVNDKETEIYIDDVNGKFMAKFLLREKRMFYKKSPKAKAHQKSDLVGFSCHFVGFMQRIVTLVQIGEQNDFCWHEDQMKHFYETGVQAIESLHLQEQLREAQAKIVELEKEVADVQLRMRDEKLKLNAQFATLKTMKEAMKAEFWQRFGGATEFMMARQHFEEDQNAREDKC